MGETERRDLFHFTFKGITAPSVAHLSNVGGTMYFASKLRLYRHPLRPPSFAGCGGAVFSASLISAIFSGPVPNLKTNPKNKS